MKRFRIEITLVVVITALAFTAYQRGGFSLFSEGLISGIGLLLHELPLLAAAFLTAGFMQVLISKELVTEWLGEESGVKGILLACLGGGLIPGGPYAYYPIAGALLKSGASLGVLIAFVSAKNLWSLSRLPLEIAILGINITLSRFLITFLIPPLMGITAELTFGREISKIRNEAAE